MKIKGLFVFVIIALFCYQGRAQFQNTFHNSYVSMGIAGSCYILQIEFLDDWILDRSQSSDGILREFLCNHYWMLGYKSNRLIYLSQYFPKDILY